MTIEIHRRNEVEKVTGLSRSTIYKRISEGSFPKPIPLGGRLVGWKKSDIQEWLEHQERQVQQ